MLVLLGSSKLILFVSYINGLGLSFTLHLVLFTYQGVRNETILWVKEFYDMGTFNILNPIPEIMGPVRDASTG